MPTNTNALIYTNNGDGATSDSFIAYDESMSSPVTFNVTIAPSSSPLTVTPASLPTPAISSPYSQTLTTTGGTAPYTYALTGGTTLPPGLTLSAGGVISGTPTGSGPYNFIVRVTDSTTPTPHTYDKSYNPTIAAPVIDVTPDNPPDGGVGVPYSMQFTASGGTPGYTYTRDSGTLPTGLSLSSSGLLSGTPTAAASFTFKLKVQDSTTISTGGVHFLAQDITVTINSFPPVTLSPASGSALSAGTVGTAYSQSVSATGGSGTISYTVTTGSLPAGLTLNGATGAITGTPTAAAIGTANFTVTATAATSGSASANYSITVSAPPVVLTPANNTALSSGTVGVSYSNTSISATGGVGAITYAISSGSLPAGLAINPSTGAITGTPTNAAYGTATFTVRATAATVGQDSKTYSITIAAPPVVLTPASGALAGGVVDMTYPGASVTASGGLGVISYSVSAGALPDGLTLSSTTGAISGTPTAAGYGTKNFTITATALTAGSATANYSILITAPAMTLTAGGALAGATAGTPYSDTSITAANGLGTVTYAVTSGALPAGLSLDPSSAAITGTPSIAGPYNFAVTATDMHSRAATESYSITVAAVAPGAPTAATATALDTSADVSFVAPAFNGGSAITGYTVTSSPGGFTATAVSSPISVSGLTNGTSYTFTVTATNSVGAGPASGASNAVTPQGSQAITFTNPGAQTFGTTPTLTATASSSLPVAFTSSTAAVCTVTTDGDLTFHQAGSCTIQANQAGDAAYLAAPQVSETFAVDAIVPDAPTIGTATADVSSASVAFVAPASSGGASITTYTATSNPGGFTGTSATSPVTVSGLTNGVSYTFTVTATNVAGTGLASSPSNAVTPRAAQTITFANPGPMSFGTTPTLTASSSAGLPVAFTSSTAAVCTITPGGALTFHSVGNCTIAVDQGGDGTYLPAPTVSETFIVNAVVPGAPTMGTAIAGDGEVSVNFTAPVSAGGASITGYTVTSNPGGFVGTGSSSPVTVPGLTNGTSYTFTVTATNAAGTGPASSASNAVTPKAPQTITFANPGPQDYATPVTLSATASSGLPVTFQSGAPTVCVVTPGGAVSFRNGGTCVIEVSQAGDAAYLAAANISQSFLVSSPIFAFTPAAGALPITTVASAYSQSFSAIGGTAPYTYSIASGTLPAGLSLDAAGTLSGTPTANGDFTFTVVATDTYNAVASSGTYSLHVRIQAPIAGATAATVAANSSANVIAPDLSGGVAASVTIATAPSHGTVVVAGTEFRYTPTAGFSGSDSFTYTATNTTGTSAAATVTVTVSPPTFAFTPAAGALAGATVADAYDLTIAAANGAAPYSYAVTGGALPAGLTLAADGRLSGTPTADGAATFTVTATDANNATGTASYSLAVAVQAPSAGPATATVAANSTANVMPLNLTGGAAASVTVATAPAHGTATATGTVISYTPMAGYSGADSFTYTATNATGTSAPATVTVTVSAPTFAFTPAAGALAGATVADAYDLTIAAANGASPYTYAVTGGALPAGLTLAADGRLSGTPTAGGPATFTVTATDANNATGTASYSLAVAVEAPSAGATSATVAANSSANAITPNLSGGSAASVTVATAPAHGTATATGTVISYTPVAGYSGADSFTYTATNATGTSAPATVTVTVSAPTLVFTPAAGALAGAAVAEAYDLTVAAANGTAPYGYAITAGTLPPGLTLSAGGRISGAPTTVGASAFTVTATDANGAIGAASYSLAVAIQAPVAGPVTAVVAGDSSVNVIAANLTGGAATSIAVASPPAHGTASVSGTTFLYTPAVGYFGSDRFTYTATNATGTSAPATVDVTVSPLPLTFSPVSGPLPAAAVGVSYSRTITASGGAAPYRYAISSGALPGGLTLDGSSGTISGTPIADGDFAFSVSAMDAIGAVAQASYRITVASASFVFTPSSGSLADAMVGEAYSQRISATGGTGALVYSLKSGALPKGMVLNITTGELTGPLAADAVPDSYSFTIAVTDSRGASGTAAYTLKLNARAVTVPNVVVEVPAGSTPKDVYLNGGATGGPFTDASVASVSPPFAGTAEIIEGELAAAGSFTPVGFYLKFTPNPSYSGSAVVSYTLRSALGSSNIGSVTYRIALDRVAAGEEIDGLVRDFVRNRQNLLSSTVKVPGLIERRRAATSTDPVTTAVTPSEKGARLGFSSSLSQIQAARDAADAAAAGQTFVATDRPFDIWMNGSFLFHKDEDDKSDKWGNFALFSLGADYLLSDRALVGLSFHYDYMSDPTDEDAELKGNGWLAGPYASFEIGKGVFLDANLLYGGSSNDIDTGIFTGTFDTTRWMADVKLTGEWQLDEATVFLPKLRAVYFNEETDDYSVRNALGEVIDLKGFIEEQARLSIGFDIERTLELENGLILSPTVGADVGFASLDGEGLFGRVSAGLALSNNDNWDLDFSLLFNIEGDGSKSAGAKVGARVRF